ncbi:DUF4013 domain-containing protein [Candidatus Micrarchaeota archaeon]|nr:DUF4013 domain-containing protein [Candidatus Micrarchaeota archaeon]
MTDFANAIKKPFSDMKNLGIGVVLGAIPIVNMLTVYGYGINCAKHADKKSLPKWEDIVPHITTSIIAIVIALVYMIPAIIVGLFMAGPLIDTLVSSMTNMNEIMDPMVLTNMLGTIAIGIIPFVLLVLIAAFFLPLALTRYALKGKIGEAFAFGKIIKRALTGEYIITLIVYIGYAFIVGIILGILMGILNIIPVLDSIIGMLLGGFGMYISYVTGYTLFGQLKWKD